MRHVYNDGGRKACGYKGDAGDCVARAIAIACRRLRRSGHRHRLWQWAGSRKSPQWASLGAGGLIRSLPPPEMFA